MELNFFSTKRQPQSTTTNKSGGDISANTLKNSFVVNVLCLLTSSKCKYKKEEEQMIDDESIDD